MRILKLPAKILYDVSDEFNKICINVFLCVSIQIAARISTGKSDMAIAHCWIWRKKVTPVIFSNYLKQSQMFLFLFFIAFHNGFNVPSIHYLNLKI